jgi:hypothetical protein
MTKSNFINFFIGNSEPNQCSFTLSKNDLNKIPNKSKSENNDRILHPDELVQITKLIVSDELMEEHKRQLINYVNKRLQLNISKRQNCMWLSHYVDNGKSIFTDGSFYVSSNVITGNELLIEHNSGGYGEDLFKWLHSKFDSPPYTVSTFGYNSMTSMRNYFSITW